MSSVVTGVAALTQQMSELTGGGAKAEFGVPSPDALSVGFATDCYYRGWFVG